MEGVWTGGEWMRRTSEALRQAEALMARPGAEGARELVEKLEIACEGLREVERLVRSGTTDGGREEVRAVAVEWRRMVGRLGVLVEGAGQWVAGWAAVAGMDGDYTAEGSRSAALTAGGRWSTAG